MRNRLLETWPGLEVELRTFVTEGDRFGDRPLPEIGGKGLFTADLAAALVAGEIDAAVHSLKDLPTAAESDGPLAVVAIPPREDPRDVLIAREPVVSLGGLPRGARIGTSATRRAGQLLAARGDLEIVPLRGNVETRLAKLADGTVDAIVLAAAGLRRLEILPPGALALDPPAWLPAPGQGALAIEARRADPATAARLAPLEDAPTRAATTAERAVLEALGGGCHSPVAALARVERDALALEAALYDPAGARPPIRVRVGGPLEGAAALGADAARRILARRTAGDDGAHDGTIRPPGD